MALSEEDRLLAQSLTNFASGLRRSSERKEDFQQRDKELSFGANLQREQSERKFGQQQQILGQQQDFSAEQGVLDRAGALERAQVRGPETKINIQIDQEKKIKEKTEQFEDLAKSGFFETEIVTDANGNNPRLKVKDDDDTELHGKKGLGTSIGQGRFIRNRLLTLMDPSREFNPDSINEGLDDLNRQLQDKGVKSPLISFMHVRKGETREKYIERLRGFRKSLISREVTRRIKISENRGFAELGRREVVKLNLQDVTFDVVQEFGGSIE